MEEDYFTLDDGIDYSQYGGKCNTQCATQLDMCSGCDGCTRPDCSDTQDDYKYTPDKKIKRQYISNSIIIDGLYDRSAKLHTKPYGDDRLWESENHLYEEINYYKRQFNALTLKSTLADTIEDGGIEHTGGENCYCIDCILQDRINSLVVNDCIHTLSGKMYHQVYRCNRPYIVKRKHQYYNVVCTKNSMMYVELPLTEFMDTIY